MTSWQKTIIITGGSSGIGSALAIRYAEQKNVKLYLFGRSQIKLLEVADTCTKKGASVQIFAGDIRDQDWLKQQIENICNKDKVDLLIAAAGVSAGTTGGRETKDQVDQIFTTNINGTLNTIMPVIPFMISNMTGHIVIISSMAGLIPLASGPSYSASKAALRFFGDALRVYLKQFKIKVSVIIPGYIDTPMTKANNFPMPLIMSVDKAVTIIIKQIAKNKGIIVFPLSTYILLKLMSLLPHQLLDYINFRLPGGPDFSDTKIK
ncbi:MAG: SDR family NAD(P)-dependent oxidoreductase [Rickettsiaceae bacterium]|nr:MAG: SDR family NAD(P)-dependent oxidoreductase [Rickettsiaceae bacterium]